MEREVGGGIGMGNTCKPLPVSFQCMTKSTTNKNKNKKNKKQQLYILYYAKGFPGSSVGKESACSAGDLGLTPGVGRFPGEGNGTHSSTLAWRIL